MPSLGSPTPRPEYSVMLAPGSAFGIEHHLRIGIGQEPAIFEEGLRRTAACFAALRAQKFATDSLRDSASAITRSVPLRISPLGDRAMSVRRMRFAVSLAFLAFGIGRLKDGRCLRGPSTRSRRRKSSTRFPGWICLVRKDVGYKKTDSGELKLDLYYPADFPPGLASARRRLHQRRRRPARLEVEGLGVTVRGGAHRGVGMDRGDLRGARRQRDARRHPRPFPAPALRRRPRRRCRPYRRVGLLGNVCSGLPFLMEDADRGVLCAVVYYGTGLRLRSSARTFRLLRARGKGQRAVERGDRPARGRPFPRAAWTFVYAPGSHHAFDVLDETEESRRIVRETLDFYRAFLSPPPGTAPPSPARKALSHWFAPSTRKRPKPTRSTSGPIRNAVAYLRLGLRRISRNNPRRSRHPQGGLARRRPPGGLLQHRLRLRADRGSPRGPSTGSSGPSPPVSKQGGPRE